MQTQTAQKPGLSDKALRRQAIVRAGKLARTIAQDMQFIDRTQASIHQRAEKVVKATTELDGVLKQFGAVSGGPDTQSAPKAQKKPVPTQAKTAPKPQKTKSVPDASGNRPNLRQTVVGILEKSSDKDGMTAAALYRTLSENFGKWSRQSLYHALKNEKHFTRTGSGPEAKYQIVKH